MRLRRRLVALVSAVLMLGIGAGVIGLFVAATQGERGRDWLRRALQAQLSRSLQGTVYLGTLSGSFLTDLRTDSLEIRDRQDSVFVATGPIRVTFDPRDLIDGRIILRSAEITRLQFYMRRDSTRAWSHHKIWPRRQGARRVRRPRSAFGSVIVIENATVEHGQFILMQPWEPADSLRGARRDSAARAALADPTRDIRRVGRDSYVRTWRWRELGLDLPRTRIAYPDSAGRAFDIARLDVVESDPPFAFRNITGTLDWVGDSISLTLPHFDLPGSTGRAEGEIVWGDDLPVRYRVRVHGDSVSLRDVAWIDPAIPTSGSGRMVLDIRNARGELDILEYAITAMDLRTHRSRLLGGMTWGIGGPVPRLTEVDMEAAPLDFDLLERFNQGPFPFPFRGRFTGRVRARGGPLHRFVVDDAALTFRDDNVPGTSMQAQARGELDVLSPALTGFRGLDVALEGLDLRTLQELNPEFPRLNGTLSGTARLDSVWLDVRMSDLDVTHRDGDAPESRFLGTARLDSRGELLAYELDAATLPVSFTALARSYPGVPLRGEYSGPLRVRGTLADLFVVADLVGEAGRFETDLRLDAVAPRFRVTGRASLSALDPRRALDDDRAPTGELSARVALDVAGDSLAGLEGAAQVDVDRSVLDGVRVFAGVGRLRFADGRAVLDTLDLESSALGLSAGGALGLHAGATDSLRVRVMVDSLGGLRRWLAAQGTDSLAGRLAMDGTVRGWLRGMALAPRPQGASCSGAATPCRRSRRRRRSRGSRPRRAGSWSCGPTASAPPGSRSTGSRRGRTSTARSARTCGRRARGRAGPWPARRGASAPPPTPRACGSTRSPWSRMRAAGSSPRRRTSCARPTNSRSTRWYCVPAVTRWCASPGRHRARGGAPSASPPAASRSPTRPSCCSSRTAWRARSTSTRSCAAPATGPNSRARGCCAARSCVACGSTRCASPAAAPPTSFASPRSSAPRASRS
jgi:translocation and assembly module TamB